MTELNKIRQVSTCIPSISEFCSLCEEQYILKNLSDKLAAGRLANFLPHNANSECKQSLAKVPFVRNFHGLGKKCIAFVACMLCRAVRTRGEGILHPLLPRFWQGQKQNLILQNVLNYYCTSGFSDLPTAMFLLEAQLLAGKRPFAIRLNLF